MSFFKLIITTLFLTSCGSITKINRTVANKQESVEAVKQKICEYYNPENNKGVGFSIRRHFLDSRKKYITPSELNDLEVPNNKNVFGTMRHYKILPMPYRYKAKKTQDGLEISINIHFQAKDEIISKFNLLQKLKSAEEIWNNGAKKLTEVDYPVYFKFNIAKKVNRSHFSVRLRKGAPGPYETEWDPLWSEQIIAHEVGHMLGLHDEYQVTNKLYRQCLNGDFNSIMCIENSEPQKYHYYFILRRVFL